MVCMDYMTSKLYLIPFTRTLIGTSKRINQYTNYHTKYCVQTSSLRMMSAESSSALLAFSFSASPIAFCSTIRSTERLERIEGGVTHAQDVSQRKDQPVCQMVYCAEMSLDPEFWTHIRRIPNASPKIIGRGIGADNDGTSVHFLRAEPL